jgi:hypothetical protein
MPTLKIVTAQLGEVIELRINPYQRLRSFCKSEYFFRHLNNFIFRSICPAETHADREKAT